MFRHWLCTGLVLLTLASPACAELPRWKKYQLQADIEKEKDCISWAQLAKEFAGYRALGVPLLTTQWLIQQGDERLVSAQVKGRAIHLAFIVYTEGYTDAQAYGYTYAGCMAGEP